MSIDTADRLVPTPVGPSRGPAGKSPPGGLMPRQPRPKPTQSATPDGVTPIDARPEWSRAWVRSPSFVELKSEWHLWACELCGQMLLVPARINKRVLSSYLHDHRVHCTGNQPADEDEAQED